MNILLIFDWAMVVGIFLMLVISVTERNVIGIVGWSVALALSGRILVFTVLRGA